MQFAGVLPEDAPDPRLETIERVRSMPIPVMGFVSQPTLEDNDALGVAIGTDALGRHMMAVDVSYTLWRNPADRSDPANLAELSDTMRQSLDNVPPWPRPAWLIESVERMRYPTLWEAVRTTWHRDPAQHPPLSQVLVAHTRHLVMNRFREEHGIERREWDSPALPSERSVRSGIPVTIAGAEVDGAEIDTDPFVYAVGARLASGGTLTAVVPRDDLDHLTFEFSQRG